MFDVLRLYRVIWIKKPFILSTVLLPKLCMQFFEAFIKPYHPFIFPMAGTQDDTAWDVDVGLLINLVENFPHIYDHRHKSFKNSLLKEHTWAKIAATLKVSVEDCMRVWRNVRDKYTRERRLVMSKNPNAPAEASTWEFYDAMEFLNPFIKRRRSLSIRRKHLNNIQIITKDDEAASSSSLYNMKEWDPVSDKLSPKSISLLEGDIDDNSCEIEVTKFDTDVSNSSSIKEIIEQPNTISIIRHQTSEEAFGAYIATRLTEFPPEIRQVKKVKLFQLLEEPENVS